MRFLVVDDSSTMLASSDVDFIIADWNMPYMNGIEFIRTIEKSR